MFKSYISEVRNNQKLKPQAALLDSDLEDENRSLRRMRECKVCLSAEVSKIILLKLTFLFATFGSSNFFLNISLSLFIIHRHLLHLLFHFSLSFQVGGCISSVWPPCHLLLFFFLTFFHFSGWSCVSSMWPPCNLCLLFFTFHFQVGVVFLPCGHLATCVSCAPTLTNCPLCRSRIQATVRTFLS